MPSRVRVFELHHAQRFYMTSPDRIWVRINEADVERGCAVALEVQKTTKDSRFYHGLFIGQVHIIQPETQVVPLL